MGLSKITTIYYINSSNKFYKYLVILTLIYLLTLTINILFVLNYYFHEYPIKSATAFQYGMRDAYQYAETVKKKYSGIIVSPSLGSPEIFYLFYSKELPYRYEKNKSKKTYLFNLSSLEIQPLLFSNTDNYLFILSPYELGSLPIKHLIKNPEGTPAIKFVENSDIN